MYTDVIGVMKLYLLCKLSLFVILHHTHNIGNITLYL